MSFLPEGSDSSPSRDDHKLMLARQLIKHPCLWDRTNALYKNDLAHADAYQAIHEATAVPLDNLQEELISLIRAYNRKRNELIIELQKEQGGIISEVHIFEEDVVPEWVRVLEKRPGDRIPCYSFVFAAIQVLKCPPTPPSRLLLSYLVTRRSDSGDDALEDIARCLRCSTKDVLAMWDEQRQTAVKQLTALAKDHRPPSDWFLIDVMLLYEAELLPELYRSEQQECEIYWLVLRHRLEGVCPHKYRDTWLLAQREYCLGNRESSVLLLQRRWHELKRRTRNAMLRNGYDNTPVPPLYVSIMRTYPHLANEQPGWHNLVADDRVLLTGPVEDLLNQSQTATNNGEPAVVVLDSESDSDSDDDLQVESHSSESSTDVDDDSIDPKLLATPLVNLRKLGDGSIPVSVPASVSPAFASCSGRDVKPVRLPRMEDVRRLNSCLLTALVAPSATAVPASLMTEQVAPSVAAKKRAVQSKVEKPAPRTRRTPRKPRAAPTPPAGPKRKPLPPPDPPQTPPPPKVVTAQEVLAGKDPKRVWLLRLDDTTVPCRLDGSKMLVTSSDVSCSCPSLWTPARKGQPSQLVQVDRDAKDDPDAPRTLTPPSSVVWRDELRQRLSLDPLVYVRVLTALPNVDAARTVIAGAGKVYRYDTKDGAVERLSVDDLNRLDDTEPHLYTVLLLEEPDPEQPLTERPRDVSYVSGPPLDNAADTCAVLPEKPIECPITNNDGKRKKKTKMCLSAYRKKRRTLFKKKPKVPKTKVSAKSVVKTESEPVPCSQSGMEEPPSTSVLTDETTTESPILDDFTTETMTENPLPEFISCDPVPEEQGFGWRS